MWNVYNLGQFLINKKTCLYFFDETGIPAAHQRDSTRLFINQEMIHRPCSVKKIGFISSTEAQLIHWYTPNSFKLTDRCYTLTYFISLNYHSMLLFPPATRISVHPPISIKIVINSHLHRCLHPFSKSWLDLILQKGYLFLLESNLYNMNTIFEFVGFFMNETSCVTLKYMLIFIEVLIFFTHVSEKSRLNDDFFPYCAEKIYI